MGNDEDWLPRRGAKDTLVDQAVAGEGDRRAAAQAGLSEGATELLSRIRFEDRYHRVRTLGSGGMGHVALCDDQQIGRRVAMKVLRLERAKDEVAESRFLREARIQGRLEHPSIVPVYDLGVDPDGDVYFTMKRVHGVTLEEIVEQLREEPEVALQTYGKRRLLNAFGQICLAVDFAHQQGFLHRDIKPANVMLGSFGEVYLLDWGLAGLDRQVERPSLGPGELGKAKTRQGIAMGTPGYMSPEQAMGMNAELSPATDVYALGAILFEILCHIPLCPEGGARERMEITVADFDKRPSVRAPDRKVPRELESIILRATAVRRRERYETARDLYLDLERYLDGQRSGEQRRQAAHQMAQAALRELRAGDDLKATLEAPTVRSRREVMRTLGRALALDPENEEAKQLLGSLLHRLPSRLPPEVEEQRKKALRGRLRWVAQLALLAYLSMFLYLPFLIASGIRDPRPIILFYALTLVSTLLSLGVARAQRPSATMVAAVAAVSNLAMSCTVPLFGPLLVTPTLIALNTAPFALYLDGSRRWFAVGSGLVTVLGAIALGLGGVIGGSYELGDGTFLIRSGALAMRATPTLIFLAVIALGQVITGALAVGRMRDDLREVERRLYLYTWHLTALLPPGARSTRPKTSN